jgi:hypothetical protein
MDDGNNGLRVARVRGGTEVEVQPSQPGLTSHMRKRCARFNRDTLAHKLAQSLGPNNHGRETHASMVGREWCETARGGGGEPSVMGGGKRTSPSSLIFFSALHTSMLELESRPDVGSSAHASRSTGEPHRTQQQHKGVGQWSREQDPRTLGNECACKGRVC